MPLERGYGIFVDRGELDTLGLEPDAQVGDRMEVKSRYDAVVAGLHELLVVVVKEFHEGGRPDRR
jgi:hypothetical protein